MPLTYDDIPGSWGRYSEGWPCIKFSSDKAHNEARLHMIENKVVPYGSYVSVDNELRVETPELLAKLTKSLKDAGVAQR